MDKLFVGKNESVAELVERILHSESGGITLVIPKNSVLGGMVSNFHLIKREGDSAGKKIVVESVDENVLAFAKSSGLEVLHPLLSETRSSPFSDIVPLGQRAKGMARAVAPRTAAKKKREPEAVHEPPKIIHTAIPEATEEKPDRGQRDIRVTAKKPAEAKKPQRRMKMPSARLIILTAVPLTAVIAVIAAAAVVWNRATIAINFVKTPWSYEHQFSADSSVSKINVDGDLIPAEVFKTQRNLTKLFPASGKNTISQKATGKITIYNVYSSALQILVRSTRFETPDGKIFRITDRVAVPGAAIKNGSISPSQIDAAIVADQAGPNYNIGPVPRLTVPGFKGSPRYAGFYGEIKYPTSGGFVGAKAVPTANDIADAKSKTSDILTASLKANFLQSYPKDFKVLERSEEVNITKLAANENTDQGGNFSIFGEADMAAVGFKESDVKLVLSSLAAKDNPGTSFVSLNLAYSGPSADFAKGTETFSLSANGILKPNFSADNFKAQILGKKVGEAQAIISGLKGLSDAKISLWPIWLGSLPADANKVKIVVN